MIMDQKNRLLYLISRAMTKLKYYSIRRFGDAGITVTPSQMGIIFFLNKYGQMGMTLLSEKMGLDNSTLTRLTDKLVKSGFVERIPNPADRRGFLVNLTEKGVQEGARAADISREINSEIMAGFTDQEVETFIRVLSSMIVRFEL